MDIDSSTLDIIGIVYSALAIAISLPSFVVLETPSKSLIYLQISYLLSTMGGTISKELEVSTGSIKLSDQALADFYCPISQFICSIAFPITLLIFTVGILIIFRLITIPQQIRTKGLTYYRVHRFLKGLIRWMALGIIYVSIIGIISLSEPGLIPGIILLSAYVVFPIVQLILYRNFPEANSDQIHKWLQFLDYVKIWLFALCIAMAITYTSTIPYYFIIVIILISAFIYGYYYPYRYGRVGRIFHGIIEAMVIINIAMLVSGDQNFTKYNLDLFFLGIILIADLTYLIIECVHYYKNRSQNAQVIPQNSENNDDRKKRYEAALDDLNGSEQQLNGNIANSSSNGDISRSGVYKSRSKPLKRR